MDLQLMYINGRFTESASGAKMEVLNPATEEILAVHDAVDRLAVEDPLAAQVVKLRYFVGMSHVEIATALEIAPRSVDRHWAYARAWLKSALKSATSP